MLAVRVAVFGMGKIRGQQGPNHKKCSRYLVFMVIPFGLSGNYKKRL